MAKPPAPSDIADKFMLRLPDGMRDRIAEAAKDANRSMNAEIVARLQATFDGPANGTSHETVSRIAIAVTIQLTQGMREGIRDFPPEERDSIEKLLAHAERELVTAFAKGPMSVHDRF